MSKLKSPRTITANERFKKIRKLLEKKGIALSTELNTSELSSLYAQFPGMFTINKADQFVVYIDPTHSKIKNRIVEEITFNPAITRTGPSI